MACIYLSILDLLAVCVCVCACMQMEGEGAEQEREEGKRRAREPFILLTDPLPAFQASK